DILRRDRELLRLRPDIADLAQEALVVGEVEGLAGPCAMIRVDLRLEFRAHLEKSAVAWGEVAYETGEAFPESLRRYPRPRKSLLLHEIMENRRNLETIRLNTLHRTRFRESQNQRIH